MTRAELEALLSHLGVEEKDVIVINFDNGARVVFHDARPFSMSKIVELAGADWYIDNERDLKDKPYFVCQPLSCVQGVIIKHPRFGLNEYNIRSMIQ